eukprot:g28906.t1
MADQSLLIETLQAVHQHTEGVLDLLMSLGQSAAILLGERHAGTMDPASPEAELDWAFAAFDAELHLEGQPAPEFDPLTDMTSLIRARAAEHVGVQSTWPLQGAASRFDRFKCLEAVKGHGRVPLAVFLPEPLERLLPARLRVCWSGARD